MALHLDLPPSPRKLVFRRIVQQLRNDPVLSRALRTIQAWEGKPADFQPLTQSNAPGIRLTPTCGPDMWAFPDAQRGWLYIAVDLVVPGHDVADMLDVWWTMERAIYPPNPDRLDMSPALRFQKDLREVGLPYGMAGAYTGLVEFSQPAADDSPGDQVMEAIGQMRVEMLLNINT